MAVGEILLVVFGATAILVGLPAVVIILGTFAFSIMLDVLEWIEDKFF